MYKLQRDNCRKAEVMNFNIGPLYWGNTSLASFDATMAQTMEMW